MNTVFITFRSVTYAQRAEAALKKGGVPVSLQRTPRWMEEKGCGYSLRVSGGSVNRAVDILRKQQLPYNKVYLRRDNGQLEEWRS